MLKRFRRALLLSIIQMAPNFENIYFLLYSTRQVGVPKEILKLVK